MTHLEQPDNELELLRTALSLGHTLFTAQRHTSRPKGSIRDKRGHTTAMMQTALAGER